MEQACLSHDLMRLSSFNSLLARHYTLATWTKNEGLAIFSKLLLAHPLLFAGCGDVLPDPQDIADAAGCDVNGLSSKNVLYLVTDTHDVPHSVKVSVYKKRSRNDRELAESGELRSLLKTISSSDDVGIFVHEYYEE